MNLRFTALWFGALFCLFAGLTMTWLKLNRAPPTWDDAWYLTNSLILYDALAAGGMVGFTHGFLSILEFKAPLITALPTPFYLIFGRRWHAAFLVNISAMLLLFGVVFWIGKQLKGPRAGLIAVFVTGTMPLLYGLSRWYMVEYTLTALVAASVEVLLLAAGLSEKSANVSFGLFVGFGLLAGFGLLLKVMYPVYVAAPLLVGLWRSKRPGRLIVAAAIPCMLIAAPWYSLHWRSTVENAVTSGFGGNATTIYGTGAIFSWQAVSTYLARLVREGTSTYYMALAVLLGVLAIIRRRDHGLKALLPLAIWSLPFLIFLFGGNKDLRFVAPLLPPFALALAIGLDVIAKERTWIVVGLLVFPAIDMMSTSFGWPYEGGGLGYAQRHTSNSWSQDRILEVISQRTLFRPGERKHLLVGTDRAWFNASNFELAAVAAQLPLDVTTLAYEKDRDSALRLADSATFFVYKEGGEPESEFFSQHAQEVIRRVKDSPDFEEISNELLLPDGGVVHVWRKSPPGAHLSAGLQQLPAFRAGFGGFLELTGFQVDRKDDVLTVRYGWRTNKPPPREYWCFTHVVGENGKVLGYLDHRVLNGEPPMFVWHAGDIAVEERRFVIPVEASGAKLMLRLGLYHPQSGERLSVSLSSQGATVTDEGTALFIPVR